MPNGKKRREKAMKLLLYLLKETDEEHPKSRKELTGIFPKEDKSITEKYIKNCIDEFRELGFPIAEAKDGRTYIYYSETSFTLWVYSTLLVLAESAKFLSRPVTDKIVKAIWLLAPKGICEKISQSSYYQNPVKTTNDETDKSIAAILEAILNEKKVSFLFSTPGFQRKRHSFGEEPLTASPISLIPDSDKLYFSCLLDGDAEPKNLRIENLESVRMLSEPLSMGAVLLRQKLSSDCSGRFNMFQGTRCENVTLVFPERYLRSIYDRFGENIQLTKVDETEKEMMLKTTVSVDVSPYFHWWVLEGGGRIQIISPDWVREDQINHLRKNGLQYISAERDNKKQPGFAAPGCPQKTNS